MNTSLVNEFGPIRSPNVSGAAPLSAFAEVVQTVPMLSLNNAFDDDEVHDFEKRVRERLGVQEIESVAEPKLEGLAP
jgi:DNA ligase (NAD+)